jgi:hypothetical protein
MPGLKLLLDAPTAGVGRQGADPFFLGAVQVTVIPSAARFLFGVPFVGSLSFLLAGALAFVLQRVLLGHAFPTLARSQMQAMQLDLFALPPSILMSGCMFPFRGMPAWARFMGDALPMTHFLRVMRAIMLKGANFHEIGDEFLILRSFVPLFAAFALLRFRRTLDCGFNPRAASRGSRFRRSRRNRRCGRARPISRHRAPCRRRRRARRSRNRGARRSRSRPWSKSAGPRISPARRRGAGGI